MVGMQRMWCGIVALKPTTIDFRHIPILRKVTFMECKKVEELGGANLDENRWDHMGSSLDYQASKGSLSRKSRICYYCTVTSENRSGKFFRTRKIYIFSGIQIYIQKLKFSSYFFQVVPFTGLESLRRLCHFCLS